MFLLNVYCMSCFTLFRKLTYVLREARVLLVLDEFDEESRVGTHLEYKYMYVH